MDGSTTDKKQEKGPLERCAELAAWHQLEVDPMQKERLAVELAQCVMLAAEEEAELNAEREAKEKAEKKSQEEKAAKAEKKEQDVKQKSELEAKAKAIEVAEHAAWEKRMLERLEQRRERERLQQGRMGQDLRLERTIATPENIRTNPLYQQILDAQRVTQARLVSEQAERVAAEVKAATYQGLYSQARLEIAEAREGQRENQQRHEALQDPTTPGIESDDLNRYEADAKKLDAIPLREGLEVDGEVIEVSEVDGRNYYIVEQDGERMALPAGERPEYERGDDVAATRTSKGFEIETSYGYGR